MSKDVNNYRGGISAEFESINHKCSSDGCNKLDVFDWLKDIPSNINPTDIVEVRFKNTRKGYYTNVNKLKLKKGDLVAVEANPGHDLGVVSLVNELVLFQLKKLKISKNSEFQKIYRKAKPADIEKWETATARENDVMLETRRIASKLRLNMKIGDVEFQGDGTKAIFYYIAEERVDFRELIKVLADRFKIRVEMKQIGARQEAGRIGGIGSCGRELCCATWVENFVSVTTNSARHQELSLNPQKLAGQCSKLKCCLNYELDSYIDAQKKFPPTEIPLETMEGTLYHQKTDIYNKVFWYSFDKNVSLNMIPIPVERVRKIQEMNKKGEKVEKPLETPAKIDNCFKHDFDDVIGSNSLTRFDKKNEKKGNKRRKKRKPQTKNYTKTQQQKPPYKQQKKQNDKKKIEKNEEQNQEKRTNKNQKQSRPQNRNQRRNPNQKRYPNPNKNKKQNTKPNPNKEENK
ncbi:MAG: hypothetical protein CSB01_00495 [Bacteroidia bacterium]|nr:MAG: hypothetical protein CSB01_00495 [Bacteroidia bacterium]